MSKKLFILDTNVLIHDPHAMFSFDGNDVGITVTTLEELDSFKRETSDRGRNAREISRKLDHLREKGSLKDGVELSNGSVLKIVFPSEAGLQRPPVISHNTPDNQILFDAYALKHKGSDVVFVTKDINARVKADVLGINTDDYLKGRIAEYEIFKGWQKVAIPAVELKQIIPETLINMSKESVFEVNEFIWAHSSSNVYNYRIFRYLGNSQFKNVVEPVISWPIHARNPQQLMTLDLLFDPEIQMVCLVGPAGTGKTFLALVAGLHQVMMEDLYRKMLISRPVIPLGPDIGYLPGDIQEKLHSWMQPMYDNMSIIVHEAQAATHIETFQQNSFDKNVKKRKEGKFKPRGSIRSMDDLIASGKISLEAITYMRGRSIPYQYILIDEVQNLTPHEVKTIITRVGEGSKIILSGDPYQIDSPYLDFSSNGLMVAANAFKGQSVFGTVFMETSERSELSKLASMLM